MLRTAGSPAGTSTSRSKLFFSPGRSTGRLGGGKLRAPSPPKPRLTGAVSSAPARVIVARYLPANGPFCLVNAYLPSAIEVETGWPLDVGCSRIRPLEIGLPL